MKLKRFVAPDPSKAMKLIKESFGPDAVILSSHTTSEGVELVAAVDYDESVINEQLQRGGEPIEFNKALDHLFEPDAGSLAEMRSEVRMLREIIETQMKGSATATGIEEDVAKYNVCRKLKVLGFESGIAEHLSSQTPVGLSEQDAWRKTIQTLLNQTKCSDMDLVDAGGRYVFIGPTGVGKTTTIAKLAARFVLKYSADDLGLVTLDGFRIAAYEQLLTYGKILGVQVHAADSAESLERQLDKLQHKKLVLIDTAGLSPRDPRLQTQMDWITATSFPVNTLACLSATSHFSGLSDAIKHYRQYKLDSCIVTKLDESIEFGHVLSLLIKYPLTVSYFTDGQRVPEDICRASSHSVFRYLLASFSMLSDTDSWMLSPEKLMSARGDDLYA